MSRTFGRGIGCYGSEWGGTNQHLRPGDLAAKICHHALRSFPRCVIPRDNFLKSQTPAIPTVDCPNGENDYSTRPPAKETRDASSPAPSQTSPGSLLVYGTDITAPQAEGSNLEHCYATTAVAYHHETREVWRCTRLVDTEKAGNCQPLTPWSLQRL